MGMLEDERVGLTTDQAEKSRAMYMHSIDPENNPDPNAQEPIPVWGPEGPPTSAAVPATPAPVHSEETYTNNVQEEIVDEEDPFAQFDEPAVAEDEDPFAKYDDPSAEYADEEDPFSAYPAAEVEPEPEPEPVPEEEGDIIDAAVGGAKNMWNAAKTSWNSLFSDNEAIETLASESRGIKKTKAQEEFSETFAKNIKGKEDSLLDTIGGGIKAVYEEPKGAVHESAAQAANMAPIWVGGVAGGKLGAVAGTAILPGVGTAVGAVVGAIAGMFTGNLMIESGFALQEEALKPGMITDEQIVEANIGAAKKAAVITGVDTLTMGANRLMMGAPGRAASKAVSTHLASKGIDAADNLATRAALEASPELLGEVMEVSAEAMFKATGSVLGKKGARATVGMGLETVSEGVGDYFGTLASGKEATYGDAVIESLMAGPTSAAELAFVSTYKMGKAGTSKLLGPTTEAAAGLEADMDSLDTAVDEVMGPAEDLTGPLPQTPEAAELELEIQTVEAEERTQDIENAQDSARERVLANGGDTLDAELEASKVAQDMGASEDDIQRHLAMVNRQTEKGIEQRAEAEKVTKENAKSKIQEARKRIQEDKAYAQKDEKSGLGQTGDVGHIAASPVEDETVAGTDGDGVVRGNQMAEAFAAAANEAATSPTNDLVEPSPAQIEAGNYKKGHVRKHGMDITIENPAGSTRKAADGSWEQEMQDHYGYIKGTESAEGKTEQLDVFIGEGDGIFVVDQINEDGTFDEHKVMMGYGNSVEARRAYARNYPQGFKVGTITPMSPQKFKEWLKNGDQTQPVAKAGVPMAASAGQKKEVILSEPLEAKQRDTRTLSAAEQAEDRIEKMPGRKVRYRREDTEETIRSTAPRDVMEELDYLIEGYEEADEGNYKLALEDAVDQAEDQGNRKFLNKLRKVGIEIGMYREMPQEEIERTSTTRGNVWDFSMGGTKYVFNSDGYKTEMQEAATEDTRLEGTKIVDEQGVPLVVYRGVDSTNADKRKVSMPTFSPSKYVAGDYAADYEEGVVSSYRLNIQNPVDLDTGEDVISMKQLKAMIGPLKNAKEKKLFSDMIRQPYNWRGWTEGPVDNMMSRESLQLGPDEVVPGEGYTDTFEIVDTKEFVELMKARGHDGVIIRGPFNATDAAGVIPQEEMDRMEIEGEVEYRPFDDSQIVSEMDKVPGSRETKKGIRYRLEGVDAEGILAKVNKDGDGFTIDNETGKAKRTGFSAGIGKEKQFDGKPTAAEVDAYRKEHAAALAEKGNYLGGWMDGGKFFLDVSKVYPNSDMGRKRAYESAKSRGEFGIQDLSKEAVDGYIPIDYKPGEMQAIRGGEKFTKWFGDSKVVDEDGTPLLVFHGTDADFDAFKANAPKTYVGTLDKEGIYFTGDMQQASNYSRGDKKRREPGGGRRRVLKTYLKMSNPLNITEMVNSRKKGVSFGDAKQAAIATIRPEHDGIIFDGDDMNTAEYVVFYPEQVKSVDNNGEFSTTDSRFRYRREEADGDKYFDEQAFKDVGPRFNSRTTLVYMSPDDFLQMAEKLRFPNEQKAREVKELADEGTAYNSLPFLSFDNEGTHGQTVQHEGRHRAMELKSRGVKSMPVRLTSGEQGSKGSFRWDDNNLTVPKTLKGQSGNEIAFPKDAQATPEATPEVEAHEGRAFKNFFSAVTKGLTGTSSTGAEYKPVIGSVRDSMADSGSPVAQYSTEYIKHRGKFDDHIAFSIPGYKEVQQAVGAALAQVYDGDSSMLDIGASEGSFAKAVTAISGMKSTSLDPNADMEESFNSVSTVPGADYSMTALGTADQEGEVAWTDEDTGTDVQYFDPMGKTYDVVHEAMVFQFVSNDRQEQINRVKQLVSADGLFITEEKVFTTNQAANEALKNKDHKALYFEQKDLDAKSAEVLEGMHKNMVHDFTLETELAKNFKYVVQFWDSGNFKGYMASDSKATLDAAVAAMPDMSSDFATTGTPRTVASAGKRMRLDTGEEVNVPMTSAKAKEVLAPLTEKMTLLEPIILANPSEAPADLKAQMEKDGALKAKGVFDPETNKLYIFSENHDSDADLVRTLLHEGVAHKGLRYLLQDSHDAVMMDIYNNGDKAALGRIARRYGMDLSKTDDQIEAAEEYVASVVENDVNSTVYQKVKAAVRRALRGLGLVKEWSEEDINALLRRSKRKMQGKPMAASNTKELRQIEKRKEVCKKLRNCVKQ